MSLFTRLFKSDKPLKECPRCLGKGHVDWDDIKRLNKELKWIPGACAYCGGSGKVDLKIEDNVAVDTAYLVNNLSTEERQNIINGHPDALERAHQYEEQFDHYIAQICYLHFECGLNSFQIAKFYLLPKAESESYEEQMGEHLEYIERVIQVKGAS